MTLTRWSPVTGLATLEIDQLNRMFEAAFDGEPFAPRTWAPLVDIHETSAKDVVVTIEVPGLKREDINITFENNVLTVSGERKFERSDSDKFHRVERGYGAFRRNFTLPATIDAARVDAKYQDGVLTVTLPRREETRPRQIQVN